MIRRRKGGPCREGPVSGDGRGKPKETVEMGEDKPPGGKGTPSSGPLAGDNSVFLRTSVRSHHSWYFGPPGRGGWGGGSTWRQPQVPWFPNPSPSKVGTVPPRTALHASCGSDSPQPFPLFSHEASTPRPPPVSTGLSPCLTPSSNISPDKGHQDAG